MNNKEIKIKIRILPSENHSKAVEIPVRFSFEEPNFVFPLMRKSLVKFTAFILIAALNWAGLSAILSTIAYLNDTESSIDNNFAAGTLDFTLTSPSGFDPSSLQIGESATRTISFVNNGNIPKYKVSAANFSGLLCDQLDLAANLDGGDVEYSGKLINFVDFGPQVFADPEDWFFTLTLPSDTPENLIGENCQFNFVFFGSQVRNDLPFGQGFSDTEEENNNVTAKICYDAETRSKGYWKNHEDVYKPYLPQYLGCNTTSSECVADYEEVGNQAKVFQILQTDYNLSMRNKLRGQLLAMKFNIAHFKIGEYVPSSTSTDNLNQIVNQADDLLQQVPAPSDEALETMKNLLDGLNQDLQFRICSGSLVKVIIPNGGETWWVGQYYDLTWTTKNLVCPNDSIVSIWYSRDSGATWGNIATSTENDGIYNWRASLFLEGGTYYVPSHNARIKVVTSCSENLLVNGWDMSDFDFCPPIDYSLLTDEEKTQVEQLLADGILTEADIINREENATSTEESVTTIEEIATSTEETATSTEEMLVSVENDSTSNENQENGGIIEAVNEVIDAADGVIDTVVEGIVGEIMPDESAKETVEVPTDDMIVENAIVEPTPIEETLIIEQAPAIEEQAVIAPEVDSAEPPAGE